MHTPTISKAWTKAVLLAALLSCTLGLYTVAAQDHAQLGSDIVGPGTSRTYVVGLNGDGTIMAVGSPLNSTVAVYRWTGSAWSQLGATIFGEVHQPFGSADLFGSAVALSQDGTVLAVGARDNDGASGDMRSAGHVRVYKWNGANWIQRGTDLDGDVAEGQVGAAVALSPDGNVVALGSFFSNKVRVFRWNGSVWNQWGNTLTGAEGMMFGQSVALAENNGLVLAVGAGNDGGLAGIVRAYDYDDGVWVQRGNNIEGTGSNYLGTSVALSGDGTSLVAGGHSFSSTGRVVVMDWDGAAWVQRGRELTGFKHLDWFGLSVGMSLDGSRIVVGAPMNLSQKDRPGYARLFEWTGASWGQLGSLLTGELGEGYGQWVAMSGDGSTVAVGAIYSGSNFSPSPSWPKDAGRVQAFSVGGDLITPPRAHSLVISGSPTVGSTLHASYTYEDDDSEPESGTTFQWYRVAGTSRVAIPGATSSSYMLTGDDVGSQLVVDVTPSDGTSSGDTITASAVGPVSAVPTVRLVSISRAEPATETTDADEVTFRVEFDSDVIRVDVDDFTVTGTLAGAATIASVQQLSPSTYDVRVSLPGETGTVGLGVKGVNGVAGSSDMIERVGVFQEVGTATTVSDWGQTFTASRGGAVLEVQLPIVTNQTARSITVDLYEGPKATGTKLGTATVSLPVINQLTWVSARFSTPVPILSGQTYTIRSFWGTSSGVLGSLSNPYAGGNQLSSGVSAIANADLAFRVVLDAGGLLASAPDTNESFSVVVNQPPSAEEVTITGVLETGVTVTGSYVYVDAENDAESGSSIAWYRANDASGTGSQAIAGATTLTYALTASDLGKYIAFEVIPSNARASGPKASSGFQGPVEVPREATVTSILRQDPADEVVDANDVIFRVSFDRKVVNVDAADFRLTGTASGGSIAGVVAINGSTYDATVSGLQASEGTVGLAIAGVAGTAGNNNIREATSTIWAGGGTTHAVGHPTSPLAQTFNTTETLATTAVEFRVRQAVGGPTATSVTVALTKDSAPSVVLATAIVPITDLPSGGDGTWFRGLWNKPVHLEAGVSYRLTFTPAHSVSFATSGFDLYLGGSMTYLGVVRPTWDLRFNVHFGSGGLLRADAPAQNESYTIKRNARPIASDVVIDGVLEVDETLSGSYTFTDSEGDPEVGTTYAWYRASDAAGTDAEPIDGATSSEYRPTPADEGKYLSVRVTPSTAAGAGDSVTSAFAGPVSPPRRVLVSSITRQDPAERETSAKEVTFRVTFDRGVTSVDATDFALTGSVAGGTIAQVDDVNGAAFDVTVNGFGATQGTLGLSVKGVGGESGNNDIREKLEELRQTVSGGSISVGPASPGFLPWAAQRFTAPSTQGSAGAEVFLKRYTGLPAAFSLHVSLAREADPTKLLSETTVAVSNLPTSGQWVRTVWPETVSLVEGEEYRLTFTPSDRTQIDGASSNPYAGGSLLTSGGVFATWDARFAILPAAGGILKTTAPAIQETYSILGAARPVASEVTISGLLEVGGALGGSYVYSSSENTSETGSSYVWYRADDASGTNRTAITGASASRYTLTQADLGSYISFEVTPSDESGSGSPVSSAFAGPVVLPSTVAVTSILRHSPTDEVTNANRVTFRVAFDRSVTNVDESDFALTGTVSSGSISAIDQVDAETYHVSVSGLEDASGILGLAIRGVADTPGANDIAEPASGFRQDAGSSVALAGSSDRPFEPWAAQTFTLSEAMTSAGVELPLFREATPAALTIQVQVVAELAPSEVLASTTIDVSGLTGSPQWYQALWSSSVKLAAGVQYRLTFTPSDAVLIGASTANPHAGGTYVRPSGTVSSTDLRFALLAPPGGLLKADAPTEAQTYTLQQNARPVASNVLLSGGVELGEVLMGSYDYSDGDGESESGTSIEWYRADDADGSGAVIIDGAVAAEYTLKFADLGKYIAFQVTPANGAGVGTPQRSDYVGPVVYPPVQLLSIRRQDPATEATDAESVVFRVTFAAPVEGVDAQDFYLTGTAEGTASIGAVTPISAEEYDVQVLGLKGAEGTLGLAVRGVGGASGTNDIRELSRIEQQVGGSLGLAQSFGQSFEPQDGQSLLVGVSMLLARSLPGQGGSVPFKIYEGEIPDGDVLYAQSVEVPDESGISWVSFNLTTPLQLTPGKTYGMKLDPPGTLGWMSKTGNPYPGGKACRVNGCLDDRDMAFVLDFAAGDLASDAPGTWETYSMVQNARPTAADVQVVGTLEVGATVGGIYIFSDPESDDESGTQFAWYRAGNASGTDAEPIADATSAQYTLSSADYGKYLSLRVTPSDPGGPGETASSPFVGPIELPRTVALTAITRHVPDEEVTDADEVTFQVAFDKPVTNLDPSDFVLTGDVDPPGTISDVVDINGALFEVTVSGLEVSEGTLGLAMKGVGGQTGENDISSQDEIRQSKGGSFTGAGPTNSSERWLGQTFTVPAAMTMSGAEFAAYEFQHTADTSVRVALARHSSPDQVLAEATTDLSDLNSTAQWYRAIWPHPVILEAGVVYLLTFTPSRDIAIDAAGDDPYPGGHLVLAAREVPSWDLTFAAIMAPAGLLKTDPPSVSQTYTLQQNAWPIAVNDNYNLLEDTPFTGNVLSNDTDADSDPLSVVLGSVMTPQHGTLEIKADGSFTYTPGANFFGEDGFRYEVSDGRGGSSTADVTLSIGSVDDLPVLAVPDVVHVREGGEKIFAAGSAEALHIGDVDQGSASFKLFLSAFAGEIELVAVTGLEIVGNGTSSVTAVGSLEAVNAGLDGLRFTTRSEYFGSEAIKMEVPLASTSVVWYVPIYITPVNNPPWFEHLADPVVAEDAGAISIAGWAHSASVGPENESDQQLLGYKVRHDAPGLFSADPAIDTTTGTLTFTPAPNAFGTANVKVTLTDDGGTEDGGENGVIRTMTITVTPVDDPPVITLPASAQVLEDGMLTFSGEHGNAISVHDVDLGEGTLEVNLTAASTLSIGTTAGLVVTGNDSHALLLSGSIASVNAGLQGLVYRPSRDQDSGGRLAVSATANGATSNAELVITIIPVNDAPTFTIGASPRVDEDAGAWSQPRWATDIRAGADSEVSQALSFELSVLNHGLFAVLPEVSSDGTLSFTPSPGHSGSAGVMVRLIDDGGTENSGQSTSGWQTFTITVEAVNDPPLISVPGAQSIAPGETRQLTGIFVSDEDVAGTMMSVALSSRGELLVDPGSGVVFDGGGSTGTTVGFTGSLADVNRALATVAVTGSDRSGVDVLVTVSDGGGTGRGGVQTASVTIPVTVTNSAPIARDDTEDTSGAAIRISVLFNDSDPEGDALALVGVSAPAGGTTAMDGRAVVYTPTPGWSGVDVFTYTVADTRGASSQGTVSVRVTAYTQGPDLDGIDSEIEDGAPGNGDGNGDGIPDADQSHVTSIPLTTGDHAGDYITLVARGGEQLAQVVSKAIPDPDNAPANAAFPIGQISFNAENLIPGHSVVVEVQLPRGVEVVSYFKYGPVLADPTPKWREFLYNGRTGAKLYPETEARGPWIAIHLTDGLDGDADLLADGRIVDPGIPVLRVNEMPLVLADSVTVAEDASVTFYPLANDSDPEGSFLTVDALSAPAHGTAFIGDDGAVTYTPFPDYFGDDAFFYTASDESGRPVQGRVVVAVLPVPDALWAVPDTVYTAPGAMIKIPIFANDKHPDGDPFFLTAIGKAKNGQATYRSQRYVQYRPNPGFVGVDQFAYSIGDHRGQIARTTVTVIVGDPVATKGADPVVPAEVADTEATAPEVPSSFYVDPNYPNPFNPTTTLVFGLNEPAALRIDLFDAAGRRVRTLVADYRPAGNYREMVDLSDLPSGLYLYRVSAGAQAFSRMLHLLK